MTTINIENVKGLIKDKSFDEIKVIMENCNVKVRECKTDELKNLYLLISENTQDPTPLQIECNGLIIEKETNKIVCMCQNQMINLDSDFISFEPKNVKYEYCEDGTIIRYFNYNNNWYTATTKCIDARKSYWSSEKTFNDMFFDIVGDNTYDFSKDKTYIFILKHTENRIVVKHNENELVFVMSINNMTQEENEMDNSHFKHPIKLLIEQNKSLNDFYNSKQRGIIVKIYNEKKYWELYKYDFKEYTEKKNIRGNIPLIRMRYLELLNDPNLPLLEKYYSENVLLFTMIKHCLNNLYKQVHQLYINSHVKHQITITNDNPLFQTLKQLHGFYKKTGNIITLDQVKDKINSLDPNIIKKLLKWV